MKNTVFTALLALLGASAVLAGEYDDPGFLTEHLVSGGPPKDGIPALTNPQFVSPGEVTYVAEDDLVIGVYINGVAKAYPENLGWWHEIVNDEVGGQFISASLCPLTGTAQVFDATDADGSQIEFGVSGLLINSNLVMYDRRDGQTLYPQMIFTAINGAEKGRRLELLPAVETTWAMWKRMYPDTQVAQAGTGWDSYGLRGGSRNPYPIEQYRVYPYVSARGDYRTTDGYLLFLPSTSSGHLDARFGVKDVVLGICQGETTRAYPFADMPDRAVINDQLGEQPIVVVFDAESRTAIPYSSVVAGRPLSFYAVEAEGDLPVEFMDMETATRWNMLGQGVAGPLSGERLEQVPAYNAMWFAWATYWPGTDIWDGEGILDAPEPTAVEEETALLPPGFRLSQNVPNPFNPRTQIQYELPQAGRVRLRVFNAAGQLIRSLVDGHEEAGVYLLPWNGRDATGAPVASGTYLYRLEMPETGFSETRAMTLMR